MIIGISKGHAIKGIATGACAILSETVVNRAVGNLLISKLRAKGHTVIDCSKDTATSELNQLQGVVAKANAQYLDIFIDLHLNASGGRGSEVYVLNGASTSTKQIAQKVQNKLVSIGFNDRGVKTANFYTLKNTKCKAILIEMFFIDTQSDCDLYKKLGDEIIANKIAEAITGESYDSVKAENKETQDKIENKETDGLDYNATIVKNFMYHRDSKGDRIGELNIPIGTKVKVEYIDNNLQLAKVKYYDNKVLKECFINNVPNCIDYRYKNAWKNGSTKEIVYSSDEAKSDIGYLDPYEEATPISISNNMLQLVYSTTKGANTKTGFVKYFANFNSKF